MEKRAFLKSIALSVLSIPVLGMGQPTRDRDELYGQAVLLATRLKLGDTIGVLDYEESISIAREIFETLGFKVKEGKHIRSRYGNLAGTDQERIADIHDMFADKTVKAIVCIRGGSGTSRLLDRLDYRLIANNPKILLGYSDITALILALSSLAFSMSGSLLVARLTKSSLAKPQRISHIQSRISSREARL